MQSAGVSGAEWQSLQFRVAEYRVPIGRVFSAKWQSVPFRVTSRSEFSCRSARVQSLFSLLPSLHPSFLAHFPPVQSGRVSSTEYIRIPESQNPKITRLASAVDAKNRSFSYKERLLGGCVSISSLKSFILMDGEQKSLEI